jgi:uncharacterized protein (TIGR01777 family)
MQIQHASTVLASANFIYNWHTRNGAFERLLPPWESVELIQSEGPFEHRRARIKMKKFGIPLHWTAQHFNIIPGQQFCDEQIQGPFKKWQHHHQFQPLADHRTKVIDTIEYTLPLSPITHLLGGGQVQKDIAKMLMYRHAILKHDLQIQYKWQLAPQVIGISGASGLIGRHLVPFLTAAGHTVKQLVRKNRPDWSYELCYDPEVGILDDFSDLTMIIHLAGESIAAPLRWTQEKKNRIYRSRIRSTQSLVQQLLNTSHNVSTFICASAIGIYPSSSTPMDEQHPHGDRFLSTVVADWEAQCNPIRDKIRVCNARFGTILHPSGGIIERLRPVMKMGGLGKIASGQQYMSWIALDDALRAIYLMLANPSLDGPINVVAPESQTQLSWVKEWATACFRPAITPLPEWIVQKGMGEMGTELLLQSHNIVPKKLLDQHFNFQCNSMPDLCRFYRL